MGPAVVRSEQFVYGDNNYILLAEAKGSTNRSALYLWNSSIGLIPIQTFSNLTFGAFSWKKFVVGGAHYAIVAGNFTPELGLWPSYLYRFEWSNLAQRYLFSEPAIQTIFTSGGVAWESFQIDSNPYLAVANFFDGYRFQVDSVVYLFSRESPDQTIPTMQKFQTIPTNGAVDVRFFAHSNDYFLIFANQQGGNISIYTWNKLISRFVLNQVITLFSPTKLETFRLANEIYVVCACSTRNNVISDSSIYIYNPETRYLNFKQSLDLRGSFYAKYSVIDGKNLLIMMSQANSLGDSSGVPSADHVDMYIWKESESKFILFHSIPTTNATAIAVIKDYQRAKNFVVSFNGWGYYSLVYDVLAPLNLSFIASHLKTSGFSDSLANVVVNTTRLPQFVVQVMKWNDPFDSKDLNLDSNVAFSISVDVVSYSDAHEEFFDNSILGNKVAQPNSSAIATFVDLVLTKAGLVSLRSFNQYLNDVAASHTATFYVQSGHAKELDVVFFPVRVMSGEPFNSTVAAVDYFGNIDLSYSQSITASVTNSCSISPVTFLATAVKGKSVFQGMYVHGSGNGMIRFESGSLKPVNFTFLVIAQAWLWSVPNLTVFNGASVVSVGDDLLVFGGESTEGASNSLLRIAVMEFPPISFSLASLGSIPPPRYEHAATTVFINESVSMIIFGGRNETAVFGGIFSLDVLSSTWNSVSTTFSPRFKHKASVCKVFTDLIILIFGGIDSEGNVVNELSLYLVDNNNIENARFDQIGSIPPPLADFLFFCNDNTGYVINNRISTLNNYMYTFTLTKPIETNQKYLVSWNRTNTNHFADTMLPEILLGQSGFAFECNFHFLANDGNDSSIALYGLDPSNHNWIQEKLNGALPFFDQITISPIDTSTIMLFGSRKASSLYAYILSFTPAVRLHLRSPIGGEATIGVPLAIQPTVDVLDFNNVRTAFLASPTLVVAEGLDSHEQQIELGGTTSVFISGGVATFTDISINGNASNVFIKFLSFGLFSATSNGFLMLPGSAAKLQLIVFPFGIFDGQTFVVQPIIEIVDWAGNLIRNDSHSVVTAQMLPAVSNIKSPSVLLGNTTRAVKYGIARFTDLKLSASMAEGNTYEFIASSGSLQPAFAKNIKFTNSSQVQLSFCNLLGSKNVSLVPSWYPSTFPCKQSKSCSGIYPETSSGGALNLDNTIYGGLTFDIQPRLCVQLVYGESAFFINYSNSSLFVAASLFLNGTEFFPLNLNCSNRGLFSSLQNETGSLIAPFGAFGASIFTNLRIQNMLGTTLVIKFNVCRFSENSTSNVNSRSVLDLPIPSGSLVSVPFTVVSGYPAQLAILQAPSQEMADSVLAMQPAIKVLDFGNNPARKDSIVVTAQLFQGSDYQTSQASTMLLGSTQILYSSNPYEPLGVVQFTNLRVREPGQYFFKFSSTNLCCNFSITISSKKFNVTTGPFTLLREVTGPYEAESYLPFSVQPIVNVMDAGGRLVTSQFDVFVSVDLNLEDSVLEAILSGQPKWLNLSAMGNTFKIELFEVNGTVFILASNVLDLVDEITDFQQNTTHSHLFRWKSAPSGSIDLIQSFDLGSESIWRHLQVDGYPFLLQGISFQVIRNTSSRTVEKNSNILKYTANSSIYKLVGNNLVFQSFFETEGVQNMDFSWVGDGLYVSVANSQNNLPNLLNYATFSFKNSRLVPVWNPVINTGAKDWTQFQEDGAEFWVVSELFQVTAFTLQNNTLVLFQTIPIPNVVRLYSFYDLNRTFLAFASSVQGNSSVLLYEFSNSQIILSQLVVSGLLNITDLAYFQFSGRHWLALSCIQNGSAHLVVLYSCSMQISSFSSQFVEVRRYMDIADVSYLKFFTCPSLYILVITSRKGFYYVDFKNVATLRGTKVLKSRNGQVNFTDLAVDRAGPGYSLTFSANRRAGVGKSFSVISGPIDRLIALTNASGGFGGTAFLVQPVLALTDYFGNIVSDHPPYWVVPKNSPGIFTGNQIGKFRAGIASFTDLGVKSAGNAVLIFSAAISLKCSNLSTINKSLTSSTFETEMFVQIIAGQPRKLILDSFFDQYALAGSSISPLRLNAVDAGGNLAQSPFTQYAYAFITTNVAFRATVKNFWMDFSAGRSNQVNAIDTFVMSGKTFYAIATSIFSGLYELDCNSELVPFFKFASGSVSLNHACYQFVCFLAIANPSNFSEVYVLKESSLGSVVVGPSLLQMVVPNSTSWEIFEIGNCTFFALKYQNGLKVFRFHNNIMSPVQEIIYDSLTAVHYFSYMDLNVLLLVQEHDPVDQFIFQIWNGSQFSEADRVVFSGNKIQSVEILEEKSIHSVYIAVTDSNKIADLYFLNITVSDCEDYVLTFELLYLQQLSNNVAQIWTFSFGRSPWLFLAFADHFELFHCSHADFLNCSLSQVYSGYIGKFSFYRSKGISFFLMENSTALLLYELQVAGSLYGTTEVKLDNSSAIFSDLMIDKKGSDYFLGFTLSFDYLESDSDDIISYSPSISVQTGQPTYLSVTSPCWKCCENEQISVRVLDGGGNLVDDDNNRTISAAFDTIEDTFLVDSFRFPDRGLRCIKFFELGDFGKFIAAGMFFDGMLYNLQSPILKVTLPDPNNFQFPTSFLYARYTMGSWNSTAAIWEDVSGNNRDSSKAVGKPTFTVGTGNAAKAKIAWLQGSYMDSVNLTRLPAVFTICSVSRYSNLTKQNRVLVGYSLESSDDFFQGHDAGKVGVADYGSVLENSTWNQNLSSTDWIVMCGQNSGDNLIVVNGVKAHTSMSNLSTLDVSRVSLGINLIPAVASDFAILEIAIWSRPLTLDEINNISVYYLNILGNYDTPTSLQPGPVSVQQYLDTRGAYFFEPFVFHNGNESRYYLALANHFEDNVGYLTNSVIYQWNNIFQQFESYQELPTKGATCFTAFEINNERYLAVSNFFDGVSHAVDSVVYHWSTKFLRFEFFQNLHTVGAHHIVYFEHHGKHYLAVSQYAADQLDSAISSFSLIYRLEISSGFFAVLMQVPTKGAMQMEPFILGQDLFIAVANSADPYTGDQTVFSKLFSIKCLVNEDLVVEFYQTFETFGATQWRHFRREGLDHLAVTNWSPEDFGNSSILVFAWDGCNFQEIIRVNSTVAFGMDHAVLSERHFLFQTRPNSDMLASGLGPVSAPFIVFSQTNAGIALISSPSWLLSWSQWSTDFGSEGLQYTGGPFGCDLYVCNISLKV